MWTLNAYYKDSCETNQIYSQKHIYNWTVDSRGVNKNLLNIFQCPFNDNNPHLQVSKHDILYLNTWQDDKLDFCKTRIKINIQNTLLRMYHNTLLSNSLHKWTHLQNCVNHTQMFTRISSKKDVEISVCVYWYIPLHKNCNVEYCCKMFMQHYD